MNEPNEQPTAPRRRSRRLWLILPALLVLGLVVWILQRGRQSAQVATFETQRGPLNITVIEGGSVRAVESQEIKCEARVGYQGIKILKIVEEGYEVTADDIRTNKVLVELDSSDLQKQIVQQDIQYESAAASLTDAQQNYEIQLNQNTSDIKAAEQKVRFARMDFDKFLGDKVTQPIWEEVGLERELACEQTNAPVTVAALENAATVAGEARPTDKTIPATVDCDPASTSNAPSAKRPTNTVATDARESRTASAATVVPAAVPIDFSKYAKIEALGDGEAKQKLRKLEDDLQVARKEEGQSTSTLEGTKRLFDKGFVTRVDLERDELARENSRLKVQTAGTARDLFIKYEFPKTAEENLSKCAEASRELARARKAAISRLAQAEAKLKSAQGQFNIQSRQKKELAEQLVKCTIVATKPGLVVYGGGRDDMYYYGGEERVREGATVRERQSIITIPDMNKMSVRVKIHETYIKKIKKGQKATITVDAFPDKVLEGDVTQVGVLPDSQNMWMNPDMKVYLTTVTIGSTNDWLKPGMTAKVEILVNRLAEVTYVPVQAVFGVEGKQYCYVANGSGNERRQVQTGEFNDEFIEIKSGVKQGEHVLLRPTETAPGEKNPEPVKPATPEPGLKTTPVAAKA